MRRIKMGFAAALVCAFAATPAFARYVSDTPSVLDGTYFCVSAFPRVQIPIPWESGFTQSPTWGELDVTGLVVDLIYGENASVAGLGVGLVTRTRVSHQGMQLGLVPIAEECSGFQLGVFNRARLFNGVQLGLVNWSDDLNGLQLGLVNVITESPVTAFPVLNIWF